MFNVCNKKIVNGVENIYMKEKKSVVMIPCKNRCIQDLNKIMKNYCNVFMIYDKCHEEILWKGNGWPVGCPYEYHYSDDNVKNVIRFLKKTAKNNKKKINF